MGVVMSNQPLTMATSEPPTHVTAVTLLPGCSAFKKIVSIVGEDHVCAADDILAPSHVRQT